MRKLDQSTTGNNTALKDHRIISERSIRSCTSPKRDFTQDSPLPVLQVDGFCLLEMLSCVSFSDVLKSDSWTRPRLRVRRSETAGDWATGTASQSDHFIVLTVGANCSASVAVSALLEAVVKLRGDGCKTRFRALALEFWDVALDSKASLAHLRRELAFKLNESLAFALCLRRDQEFFFPGYPGDYTYVLGEVMSDSTPDWIDVSSEFGWSVFRAVPVGDGIRRFCVGGRWFSELLELVD